jgi:hypothetical protein
MATIPPAAENYNQMRESGNCPRRSIMPPGTARAKHDRFRKHRAVIAADAPGNAGPEATAAVRGALPSKRAEAGHKLSILTIRSTATPIK